MSRIIGKKSDIDIRNTRKFFDARAEKAGSSSPYTSILYQDSHPEVAERRDRYEKGLILPLLGDLSGKRIIDIGCGIGRWADVLAGNVESYLGVDFSESLIAEAEKRAGSCDAKFRVLAAEDVNKEALAGETFDVVIISGVVLYLNDSAVVRCLGGIHEIVRPGFTIYLREPLSTVERLTLDNFWSEELQAEYSAIYRTEEEMSGLIREGLPGVAFSFHPLYSDDELNNRVETKQFYTLIKGKGN